MYKKASRLKLRFLTEKGPLSVEQLWDLPMTVLDRTAIALEKEYKDSGKKSFLAVKSKKDKEIKLKFDIVIDILNSKIDESKIASEAAGVKEHNQKILAKIAEAKDKELDDLSVEELEKKLIK